MRNKKTLPRCAIPLKTAVSKTTKYFIAARPQPKERGSVSRSTGAIKDARSLSKIRFQAELLRVTDPRSDDQGKAAASVKPRELTFLDRGCD